MVTGRTILLCAFLLAGCAGEPAHVTPPTGATARLAGVDWTRAQRVDVTLDEYAFAPSHLTFQEGQAYRLHLTNVGGTDHTFTSPGLFSAVALRPDGAETASTGTVELPPGGTADLYFVALRPGRYPVRCDEFLHATFGMEGDATVQ